MNHAQLSRYFSEGQKIENQLYLGNETVIQALMGQNLTHCRLFLMVETGMLRFSANGKECELQAGYFADIFEGTILQFLSMDAETRAYCLITTYDIIGQMLSNVKMLPDEYVLGCTLYPVSHFGIERCRQLLAPIRLLQQTLLNETNVFRKELACTYLRAFLLELSNTIAILNDNRKESVVFGHRDRVVVAFMRLMWENFKTQHQLAFYATELKMSSKHLSRLVNSVLGKSPHTLIKNQLVHCAMSMLETETCSVQQISTQLHFADQAAFCKFFKLYTGQSPTDYRKKLRS